jgi:prepilin-type N-terminal cleavage/methylation domain-containing protein
MMTQHRRDGFTLVELLVVITILGILVALLVPVIFGAITTAKNAQVTGEINMLAQGLASFKNKFGDYPPSRIVLWENGGWQTNVAPSTIYGLDATNRMTYTPDYLPIGGDQLVTGTTSPLQPANYSALANRSLRYLRKFFPRARFLPSGAVFASPAVDWYDFNGNGRFEESIPILLEGHECLAFFLGGIPVHDSSSGAGRIVGVSGFTKDPVNPFRPETSAGNQNRDQPFFEFKPNQLVDDDHDGIPGYIDTLGQADAGRYFAYFSGYGGTGYDPDDVNFASATMGESAPFGRSFVLSFPVRDTTGAALRETTSPLPNPYTSGPGYPTNGTASAYINDQSYQIISAGRDRQFGVGGRFTPDSNAERLPDDPPIPAGERGRERDNLSNFSQGTLE